MTHTTHKSWLFRMINAFWGDILFSLRDLFWKKRYETHTEQLIQQHTDQPPSGDAHVLLFVHGLRGTASHFFEIMRTLHRHLKHHSFLFKTHNTEPHRSLATDTRDLADALLKHHHQKLLLIGHSRGGHLMVRAIDELHERKEKTRDKTYRTKIEKVLNNISGIITIASPLRAAEVAHIYDRFTKKASQTSPDMPIIKIGLISWIAMILQRGLEQFGIAQSQQDYHPESEELSLRQDTLDLLKNKARYLCSTYDIIVGPVHNQHLTTDTDPQVYPIHAGHMSILSHRDLLKKLVAIVKKLFQAAPTQVATSSTSETKNGLNFRSIASDDLKTSTASRSPFAFTTQDSDGASTTETFRHMLDVNTASPSLLAHASSASPNPWPRAPALASDADDGSMTDDETPNTPPSQAKHEANPTDAARLYASPPTEEDAHFNPPASSASPERGLSDQSSAEATDAPLCSPVGVDQSSPLFKNALCYPNNSLAQPTSDTLLTWTSPYNDHRKRNNIKKMRKHITSQSPSLTS